MLYKLNCDTFSVVVTFNNLKQHLHCCRLSKHFHKYYNTKFHKQLALCELSISKDHLHWFTKSKVCTVVVSDVIINDKWLDAAVIKQLELFIHLTCLTVVYTGFELFGDSSAWTVLTNRINVLKIENQLLHITDDNFYCFIQLFKNLKRFHGEHLRICQIDSKNIETFYLFYCNVNCNKFIINPTEITHLHLIKCEISNAISLKLLCNLVRFEISDFSDSVLSAIPQTLEELIIVNVADYSALKVIKDHFSLLTALTIKNIEFKHEFASFMNDLPATLTHLTLGGIRIFANANQLKIFYIHQVCPQTFTIQLSSLLGPYLTSYTDVTIYNRSHIDVDVREKSLLWKIPALNDNSRILLTTIENFEHSYSLLPTDTLFTLCRVDEKYNNFLIETTDGDLLQLSDNYVISKVPKIPNEIFVPRRLSDRDEGFYLKKFATLAFNALDQLQICNLSFDSIYEDEYRSFFRT